MSHLAFCMPAGAGHLNPTLAVAAELTKRGHRVTYAAPEFVGDRIRETGAELVPYESTWGNVKEPPKFDRKDLGRAMAMNLRETKAVLAQVEQTFPGPPDLVVHDGPMGWWGRLLAAKWQVPAVVTWPHLVSNDHWKLAQYLPVNPLSPTLLLAMARTLRLAARYGVPGTSLTDGGGSAAQLVFLPRAFQFAGDTFDERYHFVGPALGERAFQGGWTPPADGRDVVYISFGTAYNDRAGFYRTCVEAFAGADLHVVLAHGKQVDPASLGPVPDNVELHDQVPQLDVLRHAKVFVTHAGMGSTMEALSFGVPLVAVPQMGEQRANADRIAELGLGRRLAPEDVTPAKIKEAVTSALGDTGVTASLARMRREIEEAGGAEAAADVVEAVLKA
ncbi:glycosyl transferase [Amycolatopsis sp. NBRC 101858]|uniref:macrolide family glycosyltransferase n=1 Tax=Amycolatopsis sp. NBRC 101858 TaxID=3032200 RepID=UPI0024A3BDC7|nr:macrolide family glycosyltransferase [Amycolatopsis sp. NBRC 101858]GLY36334.1 glycosyl transferase [Amycolatopsis sp. NBRC 101858]